MSVTIGSDSKKPSKWQFLKRIRKRTIIQLIIGVAIVLWLLQVANIGDTFSSILKVNLLNLLTAAGLFITASTLVGLALYTPLRHANPNASIPKVIMASYGGQLLSDVTPARSGYFVTPILVNRLAGIPVDQGMAAVLATGVVNAFVKAVICLVGLGFFVSYLPLPAAILDSIIVGIVVLLVAGTFLLLLMYVKHLSKLVKKLEKLPMIGKSLPGFTQMFTNVQREGVKVKRSLIVVTLLVLTSLLLNAVALYLVFNGLWAGSSLSILDFFIVASFASVLTYVPITIAGLGVQEAGYVVLLSLLLGLSAGNVDPRLLAFAFIARILFTGTDIIAIGPLLRVGFKQDAVAVAQEVPVSK